MFKKILMAHDGSEHADRALTVAVDMATKYEATLLVCHVVTVFSARPEYERLVADKAKNLFRTIGHEVAEKILSDVGSRLDAMGFNSWEKKIAEGSPARAVVETAGQEHADLIVVGTRGLSGLQGIALGSVAQKISSLSQSPVVIVK